MRSIEFWFNGSSYHSICAVASLTSVRHRSFGVTGLVLFLIYHTCRLLLPTIHSSTLHFCSALAVVSPSSSLVPRSIICQYLKLIICGIVYTNSLLANLNIRKTIKTAVSTFENSSNIFLPTRGCQNSDFIATQVWGNNHLVKKSNSYYLLRDHWPISRYRSTPLP